MSSDGTRRAEGSLVEHPMGDELLRGHAELERTERGWLPHRLPARARAQCTDPQLAGAESQPSGVRLTFRTTATVIELETLRTRVVLTGLPDRPEGVIDLRIDGHLAAQLETSGGDVVAVDLATGATELRAGASGLARFDGLPPGDKLVELWLPHHERVELVALRADAPLAPPGPADAGPVWLHHGSSISQGSNAASPSTTWPALAARLGGAQLVNLGFGGSAMLDPFTARAMRDTEADLISVKIGINLVNHDLMRLRAFGPAVHGFLDTIRDGHPTTPLLVITPIHCPIHEHTPGPGSFDPEAIAAGQVRFAATAPALDPDAPPTPLDRLTLVGIRRALTELVAGRATDDENLAVLDGLQLYGEADEATHPLPDALHPDAATHELIATRFAALAFGDSGPFTR